MFSGLSTEDYKKVMTVLEQAILATDLASYFEKKDKFKVAADEGEIDWQVHNSTATTLHQHTTSTIQSCISALV